MEPITSLQNDRVKLAYGLQQRARTRRKERKIALEGARLVRDAVERGHKPHFVLYRPGGVDEELLVLLAEKTGELLPVSDEISAHISDTQTPQGLVGVFDLPAPPLPRKPRRVLILDRVRDPGNAGTILRTAAAAGVDVVIFGPGSVDPYNPKCLRSGMGAHFRVPVAEADWERIGGYCERLAVCVTAGDGETAYDAVDWAQPWAVIIGAEADGVGADAEAIASARIMIPMAAATESLNAAVAAGVILFEAARQAR